MRVMLIQVGESDTREFPIDADEYVIGREHSCNLRLDHGRISRNHCRIHLVGDKVLVEALYSAAGTAVNQKVLDPNRPPVEVHDGDHLWVGPEHFQFLIESNTRGPNRSTVGLGSSADVEPISNPLLKFEPPSNPLLKTTTATPYRVAPPHTARPAAATEKGREPEPAEPEEESEPLGTLVVTQEDGVALVRLLQKAIVSDTDIRAITEELGGLIDAGQNRITLHLGNVERLTSEVLGEVFQVYRRCKAEGGMLKICKVSPQVASVFALTNMQKHIEIFPDEKQALKSAWPRQAPKPAPEPMPAPDVSKAEPLQAPAGPTAGRVQLVVEVGRAKGRALEISVPRFLIGRDEQCQLRPNSNEISRLHAAIEQREGRVFVCDLGSQAGTVLNGRVLHDEEAEASDGDRLQIEALRFTFAIETRAASGPSQATAETLGALFGGPSSDSNAATTLMPLQDFAAAPTLPAEAKSRRRPHLTFQVIGGVNVVSILTADLSDEWIISAVRSELEAIPFHPVRERRVICFDRVTTFSRGAVVMFLAHAQSHARNRGTLRFCNVSPSILSYLETTQLPLMIDIFPTLQEAMGAPWDAKEESQEAAARAGSL